MYTLPRCGTLILDREKGERERGKRERECVCVCVCVCARRSHVTKYREFPISSHKTHPVVKVLYTLHANNSLMLFYLAFLYFILTTSIHTVGSQVVIV